MLYSFTLGRNKDLSIAELNAVFNERKVEASTNYTFVHTEEELNQESLNKLGGVIKISKVHNRVLKNELINAICEVILNNTNIEKKIIYAINIDPISKQSKKFLKSTLASVKKLLKDNGAKTRFMNKFANEGAENIKSIQSIKEILNKENTIEINLIHDQNEFYITSLVASQDIEQYSKRDYEKPKRDAAVGMLPPKLSQILINLATKKEDKREVTIIDPFCGLGGLLIESLLMGYNIQGSDKNERMVEGSRANINWLIDEYNLNKKLNIKLFKHDATQRFPKAKKSAIIATEGYLGEPLKYFPNEEAIHHNFRELTKLYVDFFKNLWNMYDKVQIAICIPNYIGRHELKEPKIIDKVLKLGFIQVPLTKKSATFLYKRPDQIVGRRICLFKKVEK